MSGRQIQDSLKRYGLRLTNVTVAINENVKLEPPRMKKKKLDGTRGNHYEVTTAGVEYVESMLDASGLSEGIQKVVPGNRAELDSSTAPKR